MCPDSETGGGFSGPPDEEPKLELFQKLKGRWERAALQADGEYANHKLTEPHRRELYRRGLSDETIAEQRFFTTPAGSNAELMFHNGAVAKCGAILCLPSYDPLFEMSVVGLLGKPDSPRIASDQKPAKYEQPYGLGPQYSCTTYFPRGFLKRVRDPNTKFVICVESWLDALLLWQLGYCAFAVGGVNGWGKTARKGSRSRGVNQYILQMMPELKRVGTFVYCPDSDLSDNDNVDKQSRAFTAAMRDGGTKKARSKKAAEADKTRILTGILTMPDGSNDPRDPIGAKVGPADFLLPHDSAQEITEPKQVIEEKHKQFNELIIEALETPPELDRIQEQEYVDLAHEFRDDPNTPELAYGYANAFWTWCEERNLWREVSEKNLECDVLNFFNARYSGVSTKTAKEIIGQLAALVRLPHDANPPIWRGEAPEHFEGKSLSDCVTTKNMTIHLPTGETVAPTSELFNTNSVDARWAKDAERPKRWLKFLEQTFGDDLDSPMLLQEVMGYLLTPDTSRHKIFMMIGPPRCGKGTIMRVIESLLGEGNCVPTSMKALGETFGLYPLVGKSLATISEVRPSGRTDMVSVTDELLAISGRDARLINRKNKDHVRARLGVRFLITCNKAPVFPDAAGAMLERLVILYTARVCPERDRDKHLDEKLAAELPGILNWAIDGYKRLGNNGDFTKLHVAEGEMSIAEQIVMAGSPIRSLLDEKFEFDPEAMVSEDRTYMAYAAACEISNEKPLSKYKFGAGGEFEAAADHKIKRIHPRNKEGKRPWMFKGLKWKDKKCQEEEEREQGRSYVQQHLGQAPQAPESIPIDALKHKTG